MPLIKGKSDKAFKENVRTEMHAGKPQKQSLAIAYAMKRKAKKMASGGSVQEEDIPPGPQPDNLSHYGPAGEKILETGNPVPYSREELNKEGLSQYAEGGDASMDGAHYCSGGSCGHPSHRMMAEGGMLTKDGYQSHGNPEVDGDLMPAAHLELETRDEFAPHPDSHDSAVTHALMNQMGDEDEGEGDMDSIHPKIMKIMMGRAKGYSKGGMVANEDQGASARIPNHMAKWDKNEFDDLALRDSLEFDSTGANEGDDLDDEREDEDRKDIVSRVMKSRSKRDRMAVPGEGTSFGRRK